MIQVDKKEMVLIVCCGLDKNHTKPHKESDMAKSLSRRFDEWLGDLPEKEEPTKAFKAEANSRLTTSVKDMKREYAWLRRLEQLHAARATV